MSAAIPATRKCCFCISVGLGLVYVSVFAVTTGSTTFAAAEIKGGNVHTMIDVHKAILKADGLIAKFKVLGERILDVITSLIFYMSILFIVAGFSLLFSIMFNKNRVAVISFGCIFAAVIIGFVLILAIGYDCNKRLHCFLDMDYFSMSIVLCTWVILLILWLHYMVVINTFIMYEEDDKHR